MDAIKGRQPRWLEVVSERGENLKALVDELEEVLRGLPASPRRTAALVRCALMHEELNDGARQIGYAFLDEPVRAARERTQTKTATSLGLMAALA